MPSFDIVSEIDSQELDNAANQTIKEIGQRYDFKGSQSKVEWDKEKITITADDDMKLNAIIDILQNKCVKRNLPIKNLIYGNVEDASGGLKRQIITIQNGIPQDKAKEISKKIKETKLKVQTQIQGDQLRVTAKKIDDLQSVMQFLKEANLDIELQFENMRS